MELSVSRLSQQSYCTLSPQSSKCLCDSTSVMLHKLGGAYVCKAPVVQLDASVFRKVYFCVSHLLMAAVCAGGVTSMAAFQYKFFRTVYDAKELGDYHANPNPVKAAYCSYNNQVLQLVVSSLYISALFSGIIASKFARLYGRKASSPWCFMCFL